MYTDMIFIPTFSRIILFIVEFRSDGDLTEKKQPLFHIH